MKINSIKVHNFRNYSKIETSFSDKLNIVYGLNGSGKTNLVEAINILILTKSFRLNNDKLLIKRGADKTYIEGEIENNNDTSKYRVTINQDGKKLEINDTRIIKASDYISKLNIILYSPNDNKLITSLPQERRNLLNIEISQIYKEYLLILNRYNRLLKQRNAYLKQMLINGYASKEYLEILTKKLVEYGLIINKYRADFLNDINKYINKIYENIFGYGNLKVIYKSDFNKLTENQILQKYQEIKNKEINFGQTLIGIHRDDLIFKLDNEMLKDFGSEGQYKNSLIAFRLAELNVMCAIKKSYPILILDDLFSALDREKVNNIFNLLNNKVQTFITTTEIDGIEEKYRQESKIFKIVKGEVKEEN